MTRKRGEIVERGRNSPLFMIATIAGIFVMMTSQCDSFPLASAFIKSKGSFQQLDPVYFPCAHKSKETLLKSGENSDNGDESEDSPKKSLIELLSPIDSCRPDQMSGTNLAYIGDVVFELFVRSRHVWPTKRTSDLQNTVVSLVRAEHQSYLLRQIKESFPLTERENQVLMRGRNSVTKSKNRRNPAAYQDSTALEALVGYMYIVDTTRCQEFLLWLENVIDKQESDI